MESLSNQSVQGINISCPISLPEEALYSIDMHGSPLGQLILQLLVVDWWDATSKRRYRFCDSFPFPRYFLKRLPTRQVPPKSSRFDRHPTPALTLYSCKIQPVQAYCILKHHLLRGILWGSKKIWSFFGLVPPSETVKKQCSWGARSPCQCLCFLSGAAGLRNFWGVIENDSSMWKRKHKCYVSLFWHRIFVANNWAH